jgi:nucleoside diphosphate kinase
MQECKVCKNFLPNDLEQANTALKAGVSPSIILKMFEKYSYTTATSDVKKHKKFCLKILTQTQIDQEEHEREQKLFFDELVETCKTGSVQYNVPETIVKHNDIVDFVCKNFLGVTITGKPVPDFISVDFDKKEVIVHEVEVGIKSKVDLYNRVERKIIAHKQKPIADKLYVWIKYDNAVSLYKIVDLKSLKEAKKNGINNEQTSGA